MYAMLYLDKYLKLKLDIYKTIISTKWKRSMHQLHKKIVEDFYFTKAYIVHKNILKYFNNNKRRW